MKTTNEIFAENLRNKLYAKNKTQAELAKFLGVSQVIVSRWVNGTATPRHEKIDKICLFLNCNREELFIDHSQPVELAPEDVFAEELRDNPRLMRLLLYAVKLPPAKLDELIEIAKRK